jgi:hypothetical protein
MLWKTQQASELTKCSLCLNTQSLAALFAVFFTASLDHCNPVLYRSIILILLHCILVHPLSVSHASQGVIECYHTHRCHSATQQRDFQQNTRTLQVWLPFFHFIFITISKPAWLAKPHQLHQQLLQ